MYFTYSKYSTFFRQYAMPFEHKYQGVVGWGHKPTADKARCYALKHNLPYIALEDGFLRSLDLGCKGRSLFPL